MGEEERKLFCFKDRDSEMFFLDPAMVGERQHRKLLIFKKSEQTRTKINRFYSLKLMMHLLLQ